MNVLLVSQPARDGVLRHVTGLADFLLAKGDRVHLAYSDCSASDQLDELLERIGSAGGEVLNLGVSNGPQPRDLPALVRLLSLIRRARPDVIHAHSSKAGALVRGLGLLGLRTPILYTPHSYYRMHDPGGRTTSVFRLIERVLGRVGTTIVLSRSESKFAQRVIKVPLSRMLVSWNAVDFGVFCPPAAEERDAIRSGLGLPQFGKLLGSVGRFSPQKDPLTMYSAFAKASRELPDVHLVHLGRGELEPEVDKLIEARGISGRCHRIPYLNDTAPFYRALDGFLLTSLYEGMSYAVLEALATNLPLVLTSAPGNKDFGGHGFSHIGWCEPGNASSIAAAIRGWRRMLDHNGVPNHRAVSSRHFAFEPCFWSIREAYKLHSRLGKSNDSPVHSNTLEGGGELRTQRRSG